MARLKLGILTCTIYFSMTAFSQTTTSLRSKILALDYYQDAPQLWKLYNDSSSGYAGNDDCGEMSAWYVFGALGFYPVNPVSGEYVIGTPMLEEAVIQLPGRKTFTVKAPRKEDNEVYICSMKLNGEKYTKNYITHQDIMKGGILEFVMTASPGK